MTKRPRGADAKPKPAAKKINLGLQGGGAHGAFTWGVLDYLLEDERIDIEGISGASAGAMNAVMLADGLAHDFAEYPAPSPHVSNLSASTGGSCAARRAG